MAGRHYGPRTLANHLRMLADAIDTVSDTDTPAPMFMRIHIDAPANAVIADAERIATVEALAAAVGQSAFMGYDPAVKAWRNDEQGRALLLGTSLQLCAHAVEDPEATALVAAAAEAMSGRTGEPHMAEDGGGLA